MIGPASGIHLVNVFDARIIYQVSPFLKNAGHGLDLQRVLHVVMVGAMSVLTTPSIVLDHHQCCPDDHSPLAPEQSTITNFYLGRCQCGTIELATCSAGQAMEEDIS